MSEPEIQNAFHETHLKYLHQIPDKLQPEFMAIQSPKRFGIDNLIDIHSIAEFGMVIIKKIIFKYYLTNFLYFQVTKQCIFIVGGYNIKDTIIGSGLFKLQNHPSPPFQCLFISTSNVEDILSSYAIHSNDAPIKIQKFLIYLKEVVPPVISTDQLQGEGGCTLRF